MPFAIVTDVASRLESYHAARPDEVGGETRAKSSMHYLTDEGYWTSRKEALVFRVNQLGINRIWARQAYRHLDAVHAIGLVNLDKQRVISLRELEVSAM